MSYDNIKELERMRIDRIKKDVRMKARKEYEELKEEIKKLKKKKSILEGKIK